MDGRRFVAKPDTTESAAAAPRELAFRAAGDVVVMAVLAGVLPLVVALYPGAGRRDLAFALAVFTACYSGARLALVLRGPDVRLLQSTFWLFTYVAMGVAPLAQLVLDQYPTPVLGTRSTLSTAMTITIVGLISYDIGAHVARTTTRAWKGALVGGRRVDPRRLVVVAVIGLMLSVLLVLMLGGPAGFFESREAISGGLTSDSGSQVGPATIRSFGTVPILIALLVVTRWLRFDRVRRSQVWTWVLWLALLGANAVVNNPISNPRYWFLTVLLAMLFVFVTPRPGFVRASMVSAVGASILLFPFMDRFRYAEGANPALESNSWLDTLTLKDYDQVPMLANAVSYAAQEGHTWGGQLLGAALFPVPRSIWPGKPHDTGVVLGQWLGTNNVNLSAPLWAEFWLDFSMVGLAVAFLAFGFVSARVDRIFSLSAATRDPRSLVAVVVPVLAGYQFILLRGSLLQAMGRVGALILVVWLISTAVASRDSRDGDGDEPEELGEV